MTRKYLISALAAVLITAALYPAGATSLWEGRIEWSVDVPEMETTLYDYLTEERPYPTHYEADVHSTPQPDSEVVGVLRNGDEFSVVDAFTTWPEEPVPVDVAGGPDYAYISAYKIKSGDLEGWIHVVNSPVRCLIRFKEGYSPLREGPSPEYPPLTREEESGFKAFGCDYVLGPTVEAGSIVEPICTFDGWTCIGRNTGTDYGQAGGWLPVDAPALEFFVPAFAGKTAGGLLTRGGFTFMIPCGFASATIYESYGYSTKGEIDNEHITVTAVDRAGKEYVFKAEADSRVREYVGVNWPGGYVPFTTDAAVDWTEVEQVRVDLNQQSWFITNDEFAFDFPNERLPKE